MMNDDENDDDDDEDDYDDGDLRIIQIEFNYLQHMIDDLQEKEFTVTAIAAIALK